MSGSAPAETSAARLHRVEVHQTHGHHRDDHVARIDRGPQGGRNPIRVQARLQGLASAVGADPDIRAKRLSVQPGEPVDDEGGNRRPPYPTLRSRPRGRHGSADDDHGHGHMSRAMTGRSPAGAAPRTSRPVRGRRGMGRWRLPPADFVAVERDQPLFVLGDEELPRGTRVNEGRPGVSADIRTRTSGRTSPGPPPGSRRRSRRSSPPQGPGSRSAPAGRPRPSARPSMRSSRRPWSRWSARSWTVRVGARGRPRSRRRSRPRLRHQPAGSRPPKSRSKRGAPARPFLGSPADRRDRGRGKLIRSWLCGQRPISVIQPLVAPLAHRCPPHEAPCRAPRGP